MVEQSNSPLVKTDWTSYEREDIEGRPAEEVVSRAARVLAGRVPRHASRYAAINIG